MNLIGPARQREGLSSSGPVEVGRPVPCQGTEGSCVQPQRPTPESDFSEMSRDQFFPSCNSVVLLTSAARAGPTA